MPDPLVSVLLVCYNHEHYIEESIRSVWNQSYGNIELVVVDDHSTDTSDNIIQRLHNQTPFTYYRNEVNSGLNPSIIKGINSTNGEYISFLASDDFIAPNKIEEQLNYLLKTGKDGVYSTGYSVVEDNKSIIPINQVFSTGNKEKILDYLYQHDWGVPLQQSSLLKKKVMVDLIGLREEFKSDDWAFMIRVYEMYNIGYIDKPLFFYRIHGSNTHKRYWYTFPMRVDIASRLVPDEYKVRTLSNLMFSQGQYLLGDGKTSAFRFFISALVLNFTFAKMISIGRSFGSFIKRSILKVKVKDK